MASSQKTELLSLNSWLETDRPKRSDFVSDNNIIDSVLGGHINNADIHLTAEEREKLEGLCTIKQYSGDGEASKTIELPFSPSFVMVFKKNDAWASYNSEGYIEINAAAAGPSGYNSGGASLSEAVLTVVQSTAAQSGRFYNLNKEYSQYVAVMFR